MAAHSEIFPWRSHYGHYKYFEGLMAKHAKVTSLTPKGDGVYNLTRSQGDTLRVFICECYAFGVAEYMETVERLGRIDALIISSMWCSYSPNAKRNCRDTNVGLFTIRGFMGALHHKEYWNYLTAEEKEYFKEQGWL